MEISPNHQKYGFQVFLLLSFVSHAVLFLIPGKTLTDFRWQPGLTEIHVVVISGEDSKSPKQKERVQIQRKFPNTPTQKKSGSTGLQTTPDVNRHVYGVIQSELSRYLHYPLMAQKQGWEGTVILSLTIQADGSFSNVALHKSSGYGLLDQNAIDALKTMAQINGLRNLLNGKKLKTRLPIKYRLLG